MEKMQLFCDKEIWQKAIDKGVDKRKDTAFLSMVADPLGRATIVEAVEQGRYVMQPPRTMYKDKTTLQTISREQADLLVSKGKKVRELYKPSNVMDSVVLGVIAEIYNRMYGHLIDPHCLSYQEGTGVKKIIYNHVLPKLRKGTKGYKIDISKYFDNVNQETLDALLKSMDTRSPIDWVVWDMFHDNRVYLGKDEFTTERYMGIRQGNALSPLLANLCLKDVDEMVGSYEDTLYVRYSDDLIFLSDKADEILERIKEMIAPKGLELNPKKVQPISADEEFTFLGCKIYNGTVDISDESVQRFKRDIRHIIKPLRHYGGEGIDRDKLTRKAIKKINYKLRDGFLKRNTNFGWEQYFYTICNTDKTIRMLDEFVKDQIKMVRAGSVIHHRCERITDNEWLKVNGYISMVNAYDLFKCGRDVYKTFVRKVGA